MRVLSVIIKSLREQARSFWILILTVSMAPIFVFIYYLISETSQTHYDIVVINQDTGIELAAGTFNHGELLLDIIENVQLDSFQIPVRVKVTTSRQEAETQLKNSKSDALIIIPSDFSARIVNIYNDQENAGIKVEFVGDLTNTSYMVSAIWANEIINEYIMDVTGKARLVSINETSLWSSGNIDDFDYWIPGILILSIIMLMFSASIAMIYEVENKTILRLKLSKVKAIELLTGIGIVQILVGIISIFLTLFTAVILGFNYIGSWGMFLLIAILTSLSIIAFSLILAGLTNTANEILVVGNFPLFLFMFFSGAAFPLKAKELFTLFGYPISWQGLMSPTHAITALKKVWLMEMGFSDIIPELVALVTVTIFYFFIGVWIFKKRHMRIA